MEGGQREKFESSCYRRLNDLGMTSRGALVLVTLS